mmetsp:Transcript_13705/g.22357  ORF Transcript_13705/g.22357 Transcript_13705/m.22357 type:complete len:95 (+) Transcript_13705:315-599(+)
MLAEAVSLFLTLLSFVGLGLFRYASNVLEDPGQWKFLAMMFVTAFGFKLCYLETDFDLLGVVNLGSWLLVYNMIQDPDDHDHDHGHGEDHAHEE